MPRGAFVEINDRSGTLMEPAAIRSRGAFETICHRGWRRHAATLSGRSRAGARRQATDLLCGDPILRQRTASAKTGAASKSFGEQELQAVAPWHAELRKRTAFQSRPVASMTDGSA